MQDKIKLRALLCNATGLPRRAADEIVKNGGVLVNNSPSTLGQEVGAGDIVVFEGKTIPVAVQQLHTQVIAYYKPEGQICSTVDDKGRDVVFSFLPKIKNGKWISVGRLDVNSCGLILFTNHGELASRLMQPKYALEREYLVRVQGRLDFADIETLQRGIKLDGKPSKFDKIIPLRKKDSANSWYRVVLKSGKNREVRRLFEAVDSRVSRLIRIQYGKIKLSKEQKPASYTYLDESEIALLMKKVGL